MNLVLTFEVRFDRTPDGAVWTKSPYRYSFWVQYLEVFDRLRIVARVRDVTTVPEEWHRADGENVEFKAIPHYLGPWQYLRRARAIRRIARSALGSDSAVILHVSSQIANVLESAFHEGRPYGVQVVGDPYDVFAPGTVRHALRPFFRWWFSHHLRRQCVGACAVSYVTQFSLQRRYPPASGAFATFFSDVHLDEEAYVSTLRAPRSVGPFALVMVGSLAQLYKAPDVLIDAMHACVAGGLDLTLTIVGDGKFRSELEARAAALGVVPRVKLIGELPSGEAVRRRLDDADLFVLPSRTEGLPRALLEAMARGLPCIGSTAGGIPELLGAEDLVPPGDVAALAAKIREVVLDPAWRAQMAIRNLKRAREFHDRVLRGRRHEFYTQVRDRTQTWLERGKVR